MTCKKHGEVGGVGFSVFPMDAHSVDDGKYMHLHGAFIINGPTAEAPPKELTDQCSYHRLFCVQCVGEALEKLGCEVLS